MYMQDLWQWQTEQDQSPSLAVIAGLEASRQKDLPYKEMS